MASCLNVDFVPVLLKKQAFTTPAVYESFRSVIYQVMIMTGIYVLINDVINKIKLINISMLFNIDMFHQYIPISL